VHRLAITDQASVNSTAAILGLTPGSTGAATVSSGGMWTVAGALIVGNGGSATFNVQNGGQARAGQADIGFIGNGALTVASSNPAARSTLDVTGALRIFNGTLSVQSGGSVTSRSAAVGEASGGGSGAGTSLANVASLNNLAARWTLADALTVGASAAGRLDLTGNSQVEAGTMVIGSGAAGTVTLFRSSGLNPSLNVNGLLQVGTGNQGNLAIGDGATVSAAAARIGSGAFGALGVVGVGAGARWDIAGALEVGSKTNLLNDTLRGRLVVNAGSSVVAGGLLTVGVSGRVEQTGGLFSVGQVSSDSQGVYDWRDGTFQITGPAGATLGVTRYLPGTLVLSNTQRLDVTHTLDIGSGTVVLASSQAGVRAGTLDLRGGQIVGNLLDVGASGALVGFGTVTSKVVHAGTPVIARGGTLAVGNLNDVAGYSGGGRLQADADARLIVQSAGKSRSWGRSSLPRARRCSRSTACICSRAACSTAAATPASSGASRTTASSPRRPPPATG